MAHEPQQTVAADVLALRILLGQLIVRIAAGSQDPASVLKVLQDGASQTASRATLRGIDEPKQEEVRQYMRGSIERFFSAMRIEKGAKPNAAPAGAAKPAASAPAAKPAAKPAPKAAEKKK